MPHHHRIAVSGIITHLFAHRFVVKTKSGEILADVTPRGLDQISLSIGQEVTLEGEMKPSELKVDRLESGGRVVRIEHKKKHGPDHHHHHGDADPAIALKSARAAGYTVTAEPRRKPKHFEVLGMKSGVFSELHIELDGHIRKTRPVPRHDEK